jgi:hypothetical protein
MGSRVRVSSRPQKALEKSRALLFVSNFTLSKNRGFVTPLEYLYFENQTMKPLPSHKFTHVILSLLVVSLLNSGCFYKIQTTYKTSDLILNQEITQARVLLKNHQIYQGEILKSTASEVTIQTISEDTVTIERSQIANFSRNTRKSSLNNKFRHKKRYVIVHTEDFDFHIAQCVVDDHLKIITGNQDDISKKHQNHENSNRWLNIYNGLTEKPKNEMHIYMQEGLYYKDLFQDDNSNLIKLSFDDIEKVEFYIGNFAINSFLGFHYFLFGVGGPLILINGITFDFSISSGPG